MPLWSVCCVDKQYINVHVDDELCCPPNSIHYELCTNSVVVCDNIPLEYTYERLSFIHI